MALYIRLGQARTIGLNVQENFVRRYRMIAQFRIVIFPGRS